MDVVSDLGIQQPLAYHNQSLTAMDGGEHYLLTGSFRSLSLWLLAFSPRKRTLRYVRTIEGYGPHQYLALNQRKDKAYATSWTVPPKLFSWAIERPNGADPQIEFVNSASITAVSSYISIPPPYQHIFSAGGPTGEVHQIDPQTGGFGEKKQEILFVPEQDLASADKTRVALRYGSHGVEFTPSSSHAFIPVLGTNTIEMYTHDRATGTLKHVRSVSSPRPKDGPRHVKIHPNGRILYSITEHSNFVDAYQIDTRNDSLIYLSSRSLLPRAAAPDQDDDHFRGDTLMLAPSTEHNPSPTVLVATTRGSSSNLRGWLSIFRLGEDGDFAPDVEENVDRWQTPTSGGKANAIDLLPHSGLGPAGGLWIVLTDDDEVNGTLAGIGGVASRIGVEGLGTGGPQSVAQWPDVDSQIDPNDRIQGASHALWLD